MSPTKQQTQKKWGEKNQLFFLYCGAHDDRVFLEPESVLWKLSKRDKVEFA